MSPTDSRLPNVVFLIMDDLGWGDLACHGNPVVRTPSLDRLHAESTRLTRCYSGPLCSPARASLMTGRWHMRTRVVDTYVGRSMMDPGEVTLAHVLGAAGYRTGAFGKWHLGDCYPMRAVDRGFHQSLTHGSGGIGQPGDFPGSEYFDPTMLRNGVWEKTRGYCTDVIFGAAADFIVENRERPFFAYVATNCPHSPLHVSDRWADPYRAKGVNDTHARVYGMVENIDGNLGKLMDVLDENGLAGNTLLVFTSDHGPCISARHEGEDRFNAGLRGIKGSLYDGGIRVPCLLRLPGRFPAGRDVDRIAHPVDWLPTLAGLCKASAPADRVIDGRNLTPLLSEIIDEANWPDREIFMQWHRGDVPVPGRNCAVITQQHKYTRPDENALEELYDLTADPREQFDIAAEHPDVVEGLRARYDAWFADVSSTHGEGNFDPPRIRVGTAHEPETMLSRQDWRCHGEEGWRDEHYGHWEIDVEAGSYAVDVRVPAHEASRTVHVRFADATATAEAAAGATSCTIDSLKLPGGEGQFEAWVDEGGEKRSVKTVKLRRITS